MNRRGMSMVAAPAALAGLLAMAPMASAANEGKGKGKGKPFELPVTGTLSNGQPFDGRMTDLAFSFSNDGKLLLSGVLNGNTKGAGHDTKVKDQAFNNVVATLTDPSPNTATTAAAVSPAQATPPCPILHLVLGPLNLNLLGLVLTIPNPIIIDLTAVPGEGNLLGNLLCALVHLLDPNSALGSLLGSLLGGAFLTAFLNALNMVLAGL